MQNKNIKVSVVIPVYNVEPYLQECLDSIVNQTLKEIDIILINDGSTDKSGTIISEYAKKYKNIKVVHQQNHGVAYARNVGIRLVEGEFLYFMDSDDIVELNMLEDLYQCAVEEKLDMILFDSDVFNNEKKLEELNGFSYIKTVRYHQIYEGEKLFNLMLDNNEYRSAVWLRFLRFECIQREHIEFIEGIIHEDEWFSLQTMLKCHRVKCINKIYFHRRLRNESIMMTKDEEKSFYGYMVTLKQMCREYRENERQRLAIRRYAYLIMNCVMRNYVVMNPNTRKKYKKELKDLKRNLKSVDYFFHKKYRLKFTFLPIYTMFQRKRSR